jgi:hypothetical protein
MAIYSSALTPTWKYRKLPFSPTLNSTSHLPSKVKETTEKFISSSEQKEVNRGTLGYRKTHIQVDTILHTGSQPILKEG